MHNFGFALEGGWQVLLVGLLLGAGLPVLFAVGIRATAHGGAVSPRPVGRALGIMCFAVVVLGVALGIAFIVAGGLGKELTFEHVYPTIRDK